MALELNIEKDTVNSTDTVIILKDNTGNYSIDNTGGYGAPNPERNTLALAFFSKKMDSVEPSVLSYEITDEYTVPPSGHLDPETANEWTVEITEPMILGTTVYTVPIHDPMESYDENEIVYTATYSFLKSLEDTNTQPAEPGVYWEEISNEVDFKYAEQLEQVGVISQNLYMNEQTGLESCLNKKILALKCGCIDPCKMGEYEKIRLFIEAADIEYANGNYVSSTEYLEKATRLCNVNRDCGC